MWQFLAEINFCLYLIDLVSSDTTMTCFFFSDHWNPFLGFGFNKNDPEPIIVLDIQLKFSSDRLVKPDIKHMSPGVQGEEYSGSFVLMHLRPYYINMTDPWSYFGILLFWG